MRGIMCDGELFEGVDPLHAEAFVVWRGFQFALWWGKPEEVPENESLFAGFLAGSRISREPVVSVLERELALIGQYRRVDTRRAALRELLERTKKGKRQGRSVKIKPVKLTSQDC